MSTSIYHTTTNKFGITVVAAHTTLIPVIQTTTFISTFFEIMVLNSFAPALPQQKLLEPLTKAL